MASFRFRFLSILIAAALSEVILQHLAGAEGESRDWTDTAGRKVSGVLLEATGDSINLKIATGKVYSIPLEKLSEADREYVRAWNENAPSTPPPAPGEWPDDVGVPLDFEITTVKEDRDTEQFIYRSPHFEFTSDVRLSASVVREFSRIFEATFEAVKALPVGLDPRPPDGFFRTELFSNAGAFYAAGAPEGSGGVYMSGEKKIMIPLKNLGVRNTGTRYVVEQDGDNGTLKHEITHQVMHHWLPRTPVWFIEGWAEYIEAAPYSRGRYKFRTLDNAIVESAARAPGNSEDEAVMIALEDLMNFGHREWLAIVASDGNDAALNYKSSMLLTYYFLHLDGEGDAAGMRSFMNAVSQGMNHPLAVEKFLLRGRNYEELSRDVQKAFDRERLEITYQPGAKIEVVE